jgi:hypothetical protein
LVMPERVIAFCFMDTDRATLDDLAILRSAFENGTPLGWEAVHAFEEQQGIVLPEPYRARTAREASHANKNGRCARRAGRVI